MERREIQESEKGLLHSKQAFRYEVVKVLPELAEDLDKVFDYAKPFGNFRLAWIDTDIVESSRDTTATALGGSFGFDTASLNGFSLHVSAHTSQKIPLLNPATLTLNGDYFNKDKDSFTYLAESSIDYEDENFYLRIGRIKIDTPYADSDDIRMAANTFEGVWTEYKMTPELSFQGYYLSRWAGYDSGEAQDVFKRLYETQEVDESWGALGASAKFAFNSDDEVSLWYYHVDKMSDIIYSEVSGHYHVNEALHVEYGFQASHIQENDASHIAGDILGCMAIVDYGDFFFGFAGNYAFVDDENFITNGFGGGPYYTSLDESTIGFISEISPGMDVLSSRVGIGAKLASMGVADLTIELVHGQLSATDRSNFIKENDIALTYEPNARTALSAVFANFDVIESQSQSDSDDFNRFIVRADYSF